MNWISDPVHPALTGLPVRVSIIVAMGRNRVIGKNNALPWRLPADLRHFKSTTMGHTLIMGRKTYESIGRALPGRKSIVVTRQKGLRAEGCLVAGSIDEALSMAGAEQEVFVIGGAELFAQTLPIASKLFVTFIEKEFEGDVFFPETDPRLWVEKERKSFTANEENPYDYSFLILEKTQGKLESNL